MILNEIDLLIIKQFLKLTDKDESTTWKIMKKIYKDGSNKEHDKVKRSIEKMASYGFFEINKENKQYTLLMDNVDFKKNMKFPDTTSDAICLKIENRWQIAEL